MNCKGFMFLMLFFALGIAVPCALYPNAILDQHSWTGDASPSAPESFINYTGNLQSFTINDWLLFQNATIDFQYIPEGLSTTRAFASSRHWTMQRMQRLPMDMARGCVISSPTATPTRGSSKKSASIPR
nr:hypothetical protein [Candidatus Sigynarchaeota archaeon]